MLGQFRHPSNNGSHCDDGHLLTPFPVSGVSLAITAPMHAHRDPLLPECSEQSVSAWLQLRAKYIRKNASLAASVQ